MIKLVKTILFLLGLLLAPLCRAECDVEYPANLYDIRMSDSSPYALTMVRNATVWNQSGAYFNVVDTAEGNILWSKDINYFCGTADIYGPYVITVIGNKTTVYELGSGEKLYNLKLRKTYVDPVKDLIVGCKGKKVECHRLSDGKLLWKSRFDDKDDLEWTLVDKGCDDVIVFCSKHLYTLNLVTGTLATYKLNVSSADKKSNALSITAAILCGVVSVGLTGGMAFMPYMGTYSMNDLHSNVLSDSALYYIADKRHIACLDRSMNQVWSYSLPDNMGARSRIYCSGDTLFMLNEGYGMSNGDVRRNVGKPFFAAFDKATGENLFVRLLPEKWNESVYGKNLMFANDNLFYLTPDDDRFSAIASVGFEYPVMTSLGDVYMVDSDMNVGKAYFRNDVYHTVGEVDDYIVVGQNTDNPDFYIISRDGDVISRLPTDYRFVMLRGRRLCAMVPGYLKFADIDEMLPQQE